MSLNQKTVDVYNSPREKQDRIQMDPRLEVEVLEAEDDYRDQLLIMFYDRLVRRTWKHRKTTTCGCENKAEYPMKLYHCYEKKPVHKCDCEHCKNIKRKSWTWSYVYEPLIKDMQNCKSGCAMYLYYNHNGVSYPRPSKRMIEESRK